MPRQNLIQQSQFPYSPTARSNNKEWFDVPLRTMWRIFENEIAKVKETYGVETHSFVLMSNHWHWLMSTPDENLGQIMRFFMTETSKKIARAAGRINKIYGARYKWCIVSDSGYYANTFRYFYQNPVRALICEDVDQYPWSTRNPKSRIELAECVNLNDFIPTDDAKLKIWLNTIPPGPYAEMMKKALKKPRMQFAPHPTKKKVVESSAFL